jgi:hypothetical protein
MIDHERTRRRCRLRGQAEKCCSPENDRTLACLPRDIHTRRLMHAVCGPMTARRRVPVTPAALPSTAGLARALGGPTTITRTTGGPGSLGPGTMIRDPRRRRARTRSVVLVDGSSRGNPSELTRCLAGRPCWSQRRTTEGYLAAVVGPLSRRFSFRSPTVEREGRAAC